MIPKVWAQATRRMAALLTEVENMARGKGSQESGFGRAEILIGCSSASVKSAVGKKARVQGALLARTDV